MKIKKVFVFLFGLGKMTETTIGMLLLMVSKEGPCSCIHARNWPC